MTDPHDGLGGAEEEGERVGEGRHGEHLGREAERERGRAGERGRGCVERAVRRKMALASQQKGDQQKEHDGRP